MDYCENKKKKGIKTRKLYVAKTIRVYVVLGNRSVK